MFAKTTKSIHNLYYYKTLGLCLYVPNRLENHLIKLDVLWHKVSLGFYDRRLQLFLLRFVATLLESSAKNGKFDGFLKIQKKYNK